ncbi:MAG: NAD(+)/NADH kinase [Sphingomonadaceae bacterium]|nr:NAD(+)/NADH kinase [Sphingomonadaceae bacterium]
MATLPPRVIFVTRESEYDLLLARHATREQARFFLDQRGQSLAELETRHMRQEQALVAARAQVPDDWRQALVSRAMLDRFLFTQDDLVVALGQDGLVANVAKYLSGQPVIGVNPMPELYDGVLVRFAAGKLGDALLRAHHADAGLQHRTMVEGRLDNGDRLLALNELFIGHRSHQSARYEIAAGESSEQQSSSGIIVASGTGATGWARSIMLATGQDMLIGPEDPILGWFVREAFPSRATGTSMRSGALQSDSLRIRSQMNDGGVIFADGMEQDFLRFDWGRKLEVGIAAQSLNLVVA